MVGRLVDPYCGSGTALVAAKILNHDFIGIEISQEYIQSVEERLKNYQNELKYANEEIAKHIVTKTFKERKEKGWFTGRYGKKNNKFNESRKTLDLFEFYKNMQTNTISVET